MISTYSENQEMCNSLIGRCAQIFSDDVSRVGTWELQFSLEIL
jgi:hypothetical protein